MRPRKLLGVVVPLAVIATALPAAAINVNSPIVTGVATVSGSSATVAYSVNRGLQDTLTGVLRTHGGVCTLDAAPTPCDRFPDRGSTRTNTLFSVALPNQAAGQHFFVVTLTLDNGTQATKQVGFFIGAPLSITWGQSFDDPGDFDNGIPPTISLLYTVNRPPAAIDTLTCTITIYIGFTPQTFPKACGYQRSSTATSTTFVLDTFSGFVKLGAEYHVTVTANGTESASSDTLW